MNKPSSHFPRLVVIALAIASVCFAVDAAVAEGGPDQYFKSVELKVIEATIVARCRLVELSDPDKDGAVSAVLAIGETYKGSPPSRMVVKMHDDPLLVPWLKSADERFAFFNSAGGLLEGPRRWAQPPGILIPTTSEISSDLRVLQTIAEADAAIRKALEWKGPTALPAFPPSNSGFDTSSAAVPAGRVDRIQIDISHAERRYALPGYDHLEVPLDARIERIAFGWLDDPRMNREVALDVLRYFKSERGIELFKSELSSSEEMGVARPEGPMTTWVFDARKRAYETLTAWGVAVNRPTIHEPGETYRPFERWLAIAGICTAVALALCTLAIAFVRAGSTRRELHDHPARLRPFLIGGLFDAACLGGLAAVAGLIILTMQSRHTVRELTVGRGSTTDWWFVFDGRLVAERATAIPSSLPWSLGTFDAALAPSNRWTEPRSGVSSEESWLGVRRTRGTVYEEWISYPAT